ncbi:hypothetical protein [Flavobacterium sp.]|uniref:hypothetical protein n=1 Tax=Flavobacterium sp. TaxID=239 RepID=UPI004034E044
MYKTLVYFTVFALALFGAHYYIANSFFSGKFFYDVWQVYAFLAVSTIIILLLLQLVHKALPDKTGFAFMGLCLLKVMASVVFFVPLIQADIDAPEADVISFFIPYFLFLTFEAVSAVRLINSN